MWEPLQGLPASPSDDVKVQALWIISTAVQNNPAVQKAVRSSSAHLAPAPDVLFFFTFADELQYLTLDPLPAVLSYVSPLAQSSKQLRSKAIYALSDLLKHNARRSRSVRRGGRLGRTARRFIRYRILSYPILSTRPYHSKKPIHSARSDSDISVRRKVVFLLNNLLIPSVAAAASSSSSTRVHGGDQQAGPAVHPNSHASMVADPVSADTAPETLRALRAHGLLPVLVRELTEPTPYGPDGDEGDGRDADLEEKLARFVTTPPLTVSLFFFY